jgi:osmotically-inducible protein OsmY
MTDKELKQHVQNALDWEPGIDAKDIGVSVETGVITLRGNVSSYAEKMTAERVTLRVYGVKAVANDLAVHLPHEFVRTDTDIAQAVVSALNWNTNVPNDRVSVAVTNGWITLTGTLDWYYQKHAAARTVRDLMGVKGVTDNILVRPHIETVDIRDKIEAAFKRSAEVDARRISVVAEDGKVILAGNVRSWAERDEAERAAWAAPGVKQVEDRISVVP